MSKDRITGLNMSILEIMGALSEGNPGALRVLTELFGEDGRGFPDVIGCDSKRLYGSRIWVLYKDVCGEDIRRFRYHLQVEPPNQETGELSVTGPHAPRFDVDDSAFWAARAFGKPGSFWALQNPPGRGYRFPLAMDGSEPPIEVVDAADWSSETPREEGSYSLKIAPERENGSIFAGGNDGEELSVEIVYPAGHGLPLGKGCDGSPFHLGENKLIGAKWRKIPKESATSPGHSPQEPPR